MLAGVAEVDITPEAGIHLSGAVGKHRPARLVMDPLYAKALVLECGDCKLCLVAADLCIMTKPYCDQIRQAAVDRFGFELDAVMVHPLQIHSAPSVGRFILSEEFEGIAPEYGWLRGDDERYNPLAVEQIVKVIGQANEALQPVRMGVASGIEGRMACNRRAVLRDGKVSMPWFWNTWDNPTGNTGIRYLEGPMDPELGVICFQTDALRIPAMLVNYTCHPVVIYGQAHRGGHVVSADWPGALANELKKAYGQHTVPLITNGACGNINPWDPFDPDYGQGDHQRMGAVLAQMAQKVVESMTFKEQGVLDWRVAHLKIPIRQVDPTQLKDAQKLLAANPEVVWQNQERTQADLKWFRAALLQSVHLLLQRQPKLEYEIQVFRIGDAALVGLPGEPFVEGGLRIKIASPAYPTYIVHCVNHYVGYIPTTEAFQRGGHEVNTCTWSKLVPEALDMIVEAATSLLEDLFPAG